MASLLIPVKRDSSKQLGQDNALRLPPIEDRLDHVRGEAGERQEPADVSVRHAFLGARSVIDRACPFSIRRRQRCAFTSALSIVSSRSGFAGAGAVPSGAMISLRPPRRSRRMGMRAITMSSSTCAPDYVPRPRLAGAI